MKKIRLFVASDVEHVASLYVDCFAERPWYERHSPADVIRMFQEIYAWADSMIHVCEVEGEIVGVSVGFDLMRKDDVVAALPSDLRTGFYLSDLFVDVRMRRQRIAHGLIDARFALARSRGYTHAAVRTSSLQSIIISTYQGIGFQIHGEQDVKSTKMVDGESVLAPDPRVILYGAIPCNPQLVP